MVWRLRTSVEMAPPARPISIVTRPTARASATSARRAGQVLAATFQIFVTTALLIGLLPMPLSRSLLRWVLSLLVGRSRPVQVAAAAVIVLVGWPFLVLALLVTGVADLIGLVRAGRALSPAIRLSASVLVVLGIGLMGSAASPDTNDRTAARPSPASTASAVPTLGTATSSPPATTVASPTPSAPTAAPTESPTPTPVATPTIAPTATPAPTPTVRPVPTLITAADPRGDQFDEKDEPVDGVDYQDIVATSAEWRVDERKLMLMIEVAARPPKVDPLREVITFAWQFDSDTDGTPDWLLIIENLDEPGEENAPGWGAGLTRLSDGQTLAGPEFPGTLLVDGRRVAVTTDLYARRDRVGIAVTTEHTVWTGPTEATTIHDDLPDRQFPDGNEWLILSTP